MLKYMPLYGSILLTVIIAWIVISTIIGNRRKIGAALGGNHYVNLQSLCCAAEITPIVWTADGWVAACRECGAWQYFGDDFNEISENIIASDSRRSPAPRPSAVNGPESLATGLRPTHLVGSNPGGAVEERVERHYTNESPPFGDARCGYEPEVTSEDGPSELPYYPVKKARAAATIAHALGDEGEALAVPPPPNIGGEGHPDYQGPHYAVPHDRFVPYDVLRDPIPGAAVHIVGNAACVGPLEVEKGPGDDTLDSRREEQDRV